MKLYLDPNKPSSSAGDYVELDNRLCLDPKKPTPSPGDWVEKGL